MGKKENKHAPSACYRCGSTDMEFGARAVVSIELADASYSGTFRVWLCWDCGSMLHQDDYERLT